MSSEKPAEDAIKQPTETKPPSGTPSSPEPAGKNDKRSRDSSEGYDAEFWRSNVPLVGRTGPRLYY